MGNNNNNNNNNNRYTHERFTLTGLFQRPGTFFMNQERTMKSLADFLTEDEEQRLFADGGDPGDADGGGGGGGGGKDDPGKKRRGAAPPAAAAAAAARQLQKQLKEILSRANAVSE